MAISKFINTVLLINWALSNYWKHILQSHDSEFACKHGKVLGFSLISFWVYPSTFLEKQILNINPWIYFIVLWAYWSFYPLEPISLIVCSNDPIPLIHSSLQYFTCIPMITNVSYFQKSALHYSCTWYTTSQLFMFNLCKQRRFDIVT